ncbi:MAG: UDP-N-acetylmuramate--L-alanine ligase [Candidatus Omnitrophica bacterium]|nr:UDP-N-acetylmuramate--L-alanine ligase [Candidatus Omnitrophota bacterium]
MKQTNKVKQVIKRYHFIGIGGMGMGNLALLMLAKGFEVSGSDVKEGELIRQLREKGAKVFIGHDIRNLQGADCVVYSSAIKTDNPEFFQAVSRHIPMMRRAELLAQLLNKEVGITVAGAHGKTTTSSMASYLLINADMKPTTAVGGIVNQGDYNANLGIGRHMVAEVDESDGSFLYFSPHFSIITNIDMEHLDYYHTWEKIQEAYVKFVDRTVPNGIIITCGDDKVLRGIVEKSGRRFATYGFGDDNEWIATNIHLDASGSSYDCHYKGNFVGHFELTIPGKHNVLNSLSIIALGHELKIEMAVILKTLKTFQGVQRRFQRKGEVDGVLVVDDYGHHPTEIAATLQTAKTLDRQRLIVVFQPHRYSRTEALMPQFAGCFNLADHLILMDIYPASEKPIEGVTTQALMAKIHEKRPHNLSYLKKDQIVDHLLTLVHPGDLVVTLGAGDVTHLSDALVSRLIDRRVGAKDYGVIGVIMGGCSSEREVSLRSGGAIVKALLNAGCSVKPFDITTEDKAAIKAWIKSEKINVAFIALHGRFGEDGGIQTILDELDIQYNGCGPVASSASFNKCTTQRIFEEHHVITPSTVMVNAHAPFDIDQVASRLGGFPVVVKPACEGSSYGVNLAKDRSELIAAIDKAAAFGDDIVIQQFVKGRELTVGILGVNPLPVVEIKPADEHNFFDFQAKYLSPTTQYIVPAQISPEVTMAVQQEALKAYHAVGCEGFARVDVLLSADEKPYVLEINTIPGFTATSLLPKAARAAGIDFTQLCLTLVDMAYGKKKAQPVAKS